MYQEILEKISEEIEPYLKQGKVASYIPRLASVPQEKFGMAVQTVRGELYRVGDADESFSIQSISKLFVFTLARKLVGEEIWERVGKEPSGRPFNSLVQLEYEDGIPRNPFINAGAFVTTDIVMSHYPNPEGRILDLVRRVSNNPGIQYDLEVAHSEAETGHRNVALANFLKSYNNLVSPVEAVLQLYFTHCSLAMSCVDLARAALFLANAGRAPWQGEVIVTPKQAKQINALMITCGTYDEVGDFAYRVGLPGKSGVGGGVLAVIPGELCVCAWSPGLSPGGNSLAGVKALELFTGKVKISLF